MYVYKLLSSLFKNRSIFKYFTYLNRFKREDGRNTRIPKIRVISDNKLSFIFIFLVKAKLSNNKNIFIHNNKCISLYSFLLLSG